MLTRPRAADAAAILERSRRDPIWFATEVLGLELWSKQRAILRALRDYRLVAVRSCHGVSKTHTAAAAVLWFLLSHPRSRVITTATTWRQIEKLLWHELAQQYRTARVPLGGRLLATELRLSDGRYAIGLSSKPEEAESFAGHHAPHLLQVFDEASGVHPLIYEAAEGHMTSRGTKRLLIGNPTRTSGEFYDAFHRGRAAYRTLHISAHDAPAFTGEQVSDELAAALISRETVEEWAARWGTDSPMFQVRALGDFPRAAENAVISLGDVEDAQARELIGDPTRHEVVVACDVARFGDDETVIGVRIGPRIRIGETYVGKALTDTAGRVKREALRHPPAHVRIVIDDDGVGGGVTDILRDDPALRERSIPVVAFNGAARAYEADAYPNRRSELWFTMADRLAGLDLDPDDQLAADLTAPIYRFDAQGRRVVEAKAETKKRLGRSPDRGDMALLTLVAPRAGVADTAPAPTARAPMSGVLDATY